MKTVIHNNGKKGKNTIKDVGKVCQFQPNGFFQQHSFVVENCKPPNIFSEGSSKLTLADQPTNVPQISKMHDMKQSKNVKKGG